MSVVCIHSTAIAAGAQQRNEPSNLTTPSTSETAGALGGDPFFQPTDWLSCGITVIVAATVYWWTMAPGLTLEFSGLVTTGAAYGGVLHPPGYPVWTIYSWLFIKLLPLSNLTWRVAVGSAVAAALASGLVALMVSRMGQMLLENTATFARCEPGDQKLLRVVCGYVAGMALGFSNAVWREAVIADIWALSVLLFAAMLCLLMRWSVTPERRRFVYGALFIFGSLLTSNQELIVVTPALLLLIMLSDQKLGRDLFLVIGVLVAIAWLANNFAGFPWPDSYTNRNGPLLMAVLLVAVAAIVAIIRTGQVGSEWKSAILCGVCLLLGLAWYLYLPIVSMTNPPVNFAYPRTVAGFFHTVSRGQFERAHPTADVGRFLAQLWILTKESGRAFGWLYFVFIPLPFCVPRRTGKRSRHWMFGLTAVFVCAGPLMVATLNPSADRQSLEMIEPFFSAMFVVLSVLTGLGLMVFGSTATKVPTPPVAGSSAGSYARTRHYSMMHVVCGRCNGPWRGGCGWSGCLARPIRGVRNRFGSARGGARAFRGTLYLIC